MSLTDLIGSGNLDWLWGKWDSSEVVKDYCTCMVGEMPTEELQSVSAWESAHEDVQEACAQDAGWE